MLKKWKESDFVKKMKQARVNRAVYISAVVILLALSVVLAVTVATNRAKKNAADQTIKPSVTDQPDTPNTPDTPTPEDPDDKPTVGNVPTLALPVSGTLSQKHIAETQVFSSTLKEYRLHLGIDIETEASAPVCAVAAGKVTQIWDDPLMGVCLALSHSGECITVYKNLATDLADGIAVGVSVEEGQVLGTVGDSAMIEIAEEPHLHMEMTVKGLQVDPLDYFSAAVIETLTENSIYERDETK